MRSRTKPLENVECVTKARRTTKKFNRSFAPIPPIQSSTFFDGYHSVLVIANSSWFSHTSAEHIIFNSSILIFRFSPADRYIFVLVHVHDLSLHCHEEQDEKVHQQDRPEHRNIKHRKESHDYGSECTPRTRKPKLKFRETSGKWPIFFALAYCCRKALPAIAGVFQRWQKSNEVVQKENSQTVGNDKISLNIVDP